MQIIKKTFCDFTFICHADDLYLVCKDAKLSPIIEALKFNICGVNNSANSFLIPDLKFRFRSSGVSDKFYSLNTYYFCILALKKVLNILKYVFMGKSTASNKIIIRYWMNFITRNQIRSIVAIQPPQELCVASNFLRIPILDLQHGLISENWYYNERHESRFKYLSRPTAVLCWDDISAKRVVQIWRQVKAITIGNPWINEFKKNDSIFLKAINYDLSSNLPLFNEENYKIVLITTQWEPDGFDRIHIPEKIVKLIKDTSHDRIKWLIRFHPLEIKAVGLKKLHDYARKVFGEDIFSKLIDVSSFPLPQVLLSCTYHITSYSASAIEASLLGVKSGLWTELPARQVYFDDYIASGLVEILPEDTNEIKKIILNSLPLKHSTNNQNPDGFIDYDQVITSALNHT